MSTSVPDSSPTETICGTIAGKTSAFASGAANERPWRIDSCTSRTASSIFQLFDACPTIESAWMIGTPAFSIIDRFRAKRATAILVVSLPKTGIFSLMGSTTFRYCSVWRLARHQMTAMITTSTRAGSIHHMLFEIVTRICVGSGSDDPRPLNMPSKIGTTNVTITSTPTIAMTSTIAG